MKNLQILLIFVGLLQVSVQQSLRCYSCNNCGDRSLWERISCDSGEEEGPIGPPTTPGSPLGFSAKNISINSTIDFPTTAVDSTSRPLFPDIENTRDTHLCFTVTVEFQGSQRVNRGCVTRRQDNRECEFITDQRVTDCNLCPNDFCNVNGTGQLAYSLILVAISYLLWNTLT